MPIRTLFLQALAVVGVLSASAHAAPGETPPGTPPELQPWVPWVAAGLGETLCTPANGSPRCAWPSRATLDADAQGARVDMELSAERPSAVGLPGGPGAWPTEVRVDGQPEPVLDVQGQPTVAVGAGDHRVTAKLTWSRRPATLPIPDDLALVALVVDGVRVDVPVREDGGVRLGQAEAAPEAADRVELEVARRVQDGVPVRVVTIITLRVGGRAREVDLGPVLVPTTAPVALDSAIPARLEPDGRLIVGARPGTWRVTVEAVHQGPVSALTAPRPSDDWPAVEYWAVAADEAVRTAIVEGAPGVDGSRAPTPDAWKSDPTFALNPGDVLTFRELRRGDPDPGANDLSLERELRLALDGGALTVRDRFSGELRRDWRLDATPPLAVGRMVVDGEPVVITRGDEADGVELRATGVQAIADSQLPAWRGSLPAVGWKTDVNRLDAVLHLPPGWQLLAAPGTDRADTMLAAWTLLDLLLVVLVAFGAGRVLGGPWALVAALGLALARHGDAPGWWWLAPLLTAALQRAAAQGRLAGLVRALHALTVIGLLLMLVPFAAREVRDALFPAHGAPGAYDAAYGRWDDQDRGWSMGAMAPPPMAADGDELAEEPLETKLRQAVPTGADVSANYPLSSSRFARVAVGKSVQAWQKDPGAAAQTGPGVPTWEGTSASLSWTGPVSAEHTFRLWLLAPWQTALLGLARVALLLALGVRLLRAAPPRLPGFGTASVALVAALAAAAPVHTAHAAPDPALLDALTARMTAPPTCGDACVTLSAVALDTTPGALTVTAEVHAGAPRGVSLPGPLSAWSPASVTLDGRPARLRLEGDTITAYVPQGVHRLVATGPLPNRDSVSLRFALAPKQLTHTGTGWSADGLAVEGGPRTVQLSRTTTDPQAGPATAGDGVSAWYAVTRRLDLGLSWQVTTTVRREASLSSAASVRLPLLDGESVLDGTVETRDGTALVTFGPEDSEVSWTSSLPVLDRLVLAAPEGVPWTETWTLACGAMWSCAPSPSGDGGALLPPIRHTEAGFWSPLWQPWPGEGVAIEVRRPEPVQGALSTITRVDMTLRPGRRVLLGEAEVFITTSQGGTQAITLPTGASLRELRVGRMVLPVRPDADGRLMVPLQPGDQSLRLTWQQDHTLRLMPELPRLDLGSPAVDVTVSVEVPEERFVAWAWGPAWGPRSLLPAWLLLCGIAAWLLARLTISPLSITGWTLLLFGLTGLPTAMQAIVVGFLLALGLRAQRAPRTWWGHDLALLSLATWALVAFGVLVGGVYTGLLETPDTLIGGNGSYGGSLNWYTDRVAGLTPVVGLVAPPVWVWRALHFAWAVWLAWTLLGLAGFAWRAVQHGGLWRMPEPRPTPTEPSAGAQAP